MRKLILILLVLASTQLLLVQTLISEVLSWKYLDDGDKTTEISYGSSFSYLNSGQDIVTVRVHQISSISWDAHFDVKLDTTGLNYFRKAPYVIYPGNNDRMIILWQLIDNETSEFSYGTDTNYLLGTINTTEYDSSHQHKVVLTGLTPGQKYYYKVTVNGTSGYGSFNAGTPDDAATVTFFAYGDTRSNPWDHNDVAKRVMDDINQNNLDQTFIINLGDFVYDGSSETSWDEEFFGQSYTDIINMLANLPYVAALGNHESQGDLFKKYFPYPNFMNNRYYYSFDYGPAHVTIIDDEIDFSQGSTEYNWIVNDLSSTNKLWKIVSFHKPGWSADGGHSNSTDVQNILQPLFEQYGVKFVLNGHNHYYSRAVVNGVNHITTGGGGAPLYDPDSSYPNIVITDKSNHYCKLEIDGNTLHFLAIRSDGSLIEEFDTKVNIGINDTLNNEWSVYSYAGEISIKTKNPNGKIEVYDDSGRKIIEKNINAYKTVLNLNQTGIYFIRYILNKMSVKKIIVIK